MILPDNWTSMTCIPDIYRTEWPRLNIVKKLYFRPKQALGIFEIPKACFGIML